VKDQKADGPVTVLNISARKHCRAADGGPLPPSDDSACPVRHVWLDSGFVEYNPPADVAPAAPPAQ
jgi:hypothetical protein